MREKRHNVVTVRLNRAEKEGLFGLARLYGKSMEGMVRLLLVDAIRAQHRALAEQATRDREREGVTG